TAWRGCRRAQGSWQTPIRQPSTRSVCASSLRSRRRSTWRRRADVSRAVASRVPDGPLVVRAPEGQCHPHGPEAIVRSAGRAGGGAGLRPAGAAGGQGREMILLVDNYDSFTYNLAHYLCELGAELAVRRPDELAAPLEPSHLVLSPGPGRPTEQLIGLVRNSRVPTLGVCLGHQAAVA